MFFSFNCVAQQNTDSLKEIKVIGLKSKQLSNDQRKSFESGTQNQVLDSALIVFYQMQSIAQIVGDQSTVFVKSYGVNGLSSLSFRGASAAQSAVLWNGIPLSNPTLGMVDVSLLSTGLFDQISLQYGSSSALYGSGNVGGALLLDNQFPDFVPYQQVKLNLAKGSFGRNDIGFQSVYQNKNWRVKGDLFYQKANNDFSYLNNADSLTKMDNAQMKGMGGILSIDYNLDKKSISSSNHLLSLKLWYQQYERSIPPALFESNSLKRQLDQSFRSLIHWQKKQKRSIFYTKVSYNKDFLNYNDGVVLPNNENSVTQLYTEAGWTYRLNNFESNKSFPFAHNLLLFSPIQVASSFNKNLKLNQQQWRPAIVAAYNLEQNNQKFSFSASMRQEWVSVHTSALLPGLGTKLSLFKMQNKKSNLDVKLRANIQKTYRVPTLNELYFSPGGNPNLKPERGWNQDGGLIIEIVKCKNPEVEYAKWVFHQETTVFNRNIKDWIYWLGGAIWTPHNLAKVHSRGIETANKIKLQQNDKWQFEIALNTAYILSTTEASYLPNDGSIGKQIPYAPRYSGQLNFGVHYQSVFLNYNYQYTGYRFVTVDESQFLKPYQIGNIQAAYTWRKNNYTIGLTAQVLNITNKSYQVVNARPMPKRNFLFGVQLGI